MWMAFRPICACMNTFHRVPFLNIWYLLIFCTSSSGCPHAFVPTSSISSRFNQAVSYLHHYYSSVGAGRGGGRSWRLWLDTRCDCIVLVGLISQHMDEHGRFTWVVRYTWVNCKLYVCNIPKLKVCVVVYNLASIITSHVMRVFGGLLLE